MNSSISDLRSTLFETIAALKNGSLELDKAKAINEVAKTIVETAKVEVDYLGVTGGGESSFIESAIGADNLPKGLPNGITAITRHSLQG